MAFDGQIYRRSEKEWNKSYMTYLRKTAELAEKLDGYIKPPSTFGLFKRNYSLAIRQGYTQNTLRHMVKQHAIVSGPRAGSLLLSAKNFAKIAGTQHPDLAKFANLKARDFRTNSPLAQEYLNLFKRDNERLRDKYGIDAGISEYIYPEVDVKKSKVETPGEQFAKLLKGV